MGLNKTGAKRIGPALLVLLYCFVFLWTGCSPRADTGSFSRNQEAEKRLSVVTTLFPYYDFVRQIAGDQVELKLIVPAGMDSHSFEPTPADIIAMQEADVLILNGGEMEQWALQVLETLDTSRMEVLTMMDYVEVVTEEHIEGMEQEPASDPHECHDLEYDEHIWTSPVNAMGIVKVISQTLEKKLPDEKERLQANTEAYLKELKALDQEIRSIVSEGKRHIIIIADKFSLRYFTDEYGLAYRAAFSGCSTDTEPSARTIAYLIDQVREKEIPAVYYLELSSSRTAEIIREETGAKPLVFHSCHNVTRREFEEGITYLKLMKQNIEHLRMGLE